MKLLQRCLLQLAVGAAAWTATSQLAQAQAYPSRTVTWVVGFAPGGGNDAVARLMGQWLQQHLGQPFVIENRPGAGTNIATEAVIRAVPDGYTLLLAGFPNASNPALFGKLNFDFIRDIMPIAGIVRVPNVIAIHPTLPARSLAEFIAYAKANPGKINMASAGTGSGSHLSGELFKLLAGVDLVHVPYRGNGPATQDLLGGQVQVLFTSPPSCIELIAAGQLRGLAVTSEKRSPALPELPAVGELVPGYEMSAWYGAAAPKGTPSEVVDKLNAAINAGLADAKLMAKLSEIGGIAIGGTPADFGGLIATETEKWTKAIRAANIKAQ